MMKKFGARGWHRTCLVSVKALSGNDTEAWGRCRSAANDSPTLVVENIGAVIEMILALSTQRKTSMKIALVGILALIAPAACSVGTELEADPVTDVLGTSSAALTANPDVAWISPENPPANVPADLKVTCHVRPDVLDSASQCPVLVWNDYTYWALSYRDNRFAMAIVAYDRDGNLIKRFEKDGARYISSVAVDSNTNTVTFIGQASQSITMTWNELRIGQPQRQSVDLNGYCTATYGQDSKAGLGESNVNGWKCKVGISMTDVCHQQHGADTSDHCNPSDPYSWHCLGPAVVSPFPVFNRGIDLTRYCKQKYGPAASASLNEHNAYGWKCDLPVDLAAACNQTVGHASSVGFDNYYNPNSVFCEG